MKKYKDHIYPIKIKKYTNVVVSLRSLTYLYTDDSKLAILSDINLAFCK